MYAVKSTECSGCAPFSERRDKFCLHRFLEFVLGVPVALVQRLLRNMVDILSDSAVMLMLEECSLGFVEQQAHQSGHIDAREDQAVHVKHAVKVLDSFVFETLFSVLPANTARVEEGR